MGSVHEKDWDSITGNLARAFANHARGFEAQAETLRGQRKELVKAGGKPHPSEDERISQAAAAASTWRRREAIAAKGFIPMTEEDARDPNYAPEHMRLVGEASQVGRVHYGEEGELIGGSRDDRTYGGSVGTDEDVDLDAL